MPLLFFSVCMKLYVFNPDTDDALAVNSPYYMPSAAVAKMEEDLSLLPVWYGDGGYAVGSCAGDDCYRLLIEGLSPAVDVSPVLRGADEVSVWGWDRAVVRRLAAAGLPAEVLPDEAFLDDCRRMASRETGIKLLSLLSACRGTGGRRHLVTDVKEIDRLGLPAAGGVAKKLWSSGGRGLCRFSLPLQGDKAGRISRWLRNTGAVICEPFYTKVTDFAMEFFRDVSGRVRFYGYSLFVNDKNCGYDYSLLLPDDKVEKILCRYVGGDVLDVVRETAVRVMPGMFDFDYTGYFGIDMMICRFDSKPCYRLHPCVEINLRMNMGVVAHGIYARWIATGSEGIFRVEHFSSAEQLQADHRMQKEVHPLTVRDGRIIEGYLPLTPITADSVYRAAVWAHLVNG